MSTLPPPSTPRRPPYLVVALVAALLFGAGLCTEGCARLAFYRGETDRRAELTHAIADESDRTRAEALYQRFVDVSDEQRGRAIPLAAATFVLGAAVLALASRGLAGRSNTRTLLMQVIAAQAALVVVAYFVTRPLVDAEADWQYETAMIHQRERMPPAEFEQVAPTLRSMRRWMPPAWLIFRSLASGLIVIALSRPRSRAFFEAATRPVSDS